MKTFLGPILGFRGRKGDHWQVCALLVTDGDAAPTLVWSTGGGDQTVAARALHTVAGRTAWCADWEVVMAEDEPTAVSYRFGDSEAASFVVPGRKTLPRYAYASCNGTSARKLFKGIDDPNGPWKDLRAQHEEQPFHLLIMGGDQLYADALWEVVPEIKKWGDLPAKKRFKREFTKVMAEQVERFYFDLYVDRWSQPEPAAAFARIPTVMMWDDHDIFDGWGSYPKKQQESAVYQGIFGVANRCFQVFQLRTAPGEAPPGVLPGGGYNWVHDLGEVAIAVLDLRSERTKTQVMGRASWDTVIEAIDGLDEDKKHLLVISSIPVAYLDPSVVARAFALIPGQQAVEDDLRDQWRHPGHKVERLRLIHRLLSFAEKSRCRVTIVSGDVHVGALGVIDMEADTPGHGPRPEVIHQLVSSGIVHPPPGPMTIFFYRQIGGKVERVDQGISARMVEFAGSNRRFLDSRNWLSLTFDETHRIWAEWRVENEAQGEPDSYTVVVHPAAA